MIGFLSGKIISSKPTNILLDVNGVGYLVNISVNTFEKINEMESVSLYIHTNVKEDSISLYGFYTETEKEMFELLINVNGIGPKLAISLLSGIQVDDLKHAIQAGDLSRIIAVPGIGRKTAERIVLELKNKVDQIVEKGVAELPVSIKNEAVSALTTLGYNYKVADNTVRNILNESGNISLEELVKRALASLNR
jgi:Holliday junction DNA helicase RuvA